MITTTARLSCHELRLGYGNRVVVDGVTTSFPEQRFTAIVGPNGCGKSTLLRALARSLRPLSGQVRLGGHPMEDFSAREAARHIALLPQHPLVPEQITVGELVARGRYPHHGLLRRDTRRDRERIAWALAQTETESLAFRRVDELSGGQRQRVWLALALAQDAPIILLDEPTTFLDIAHQYEMLELFGRLRDQRRTLVAVMHDLGQAARYADHLVMMSNGGIHAQGAPAEVLTEQAVKEVFTLEARIISDPLTGSPIVVR